MQSAGVLDGELALFGCFFQARYDVRGVPARLAVLPSRRFVVAIVLPCLAQKLCQHLSKKKIQPAFKSVGVIGVVRIR